MSAVMTGHSAAPDGTAERFAQGTGSTPGAARIADAFARTAAANRAALIPYVVAGYPDAVGSLAAAVAAIDAGADLLEVGLPYSDPLADGATLQRASGVALRAGATLDRSVALLAEIAAARPGVPLVPMCYANQLLAGGGGATAARRLAEAGATTPEVIEIYQRARQPLLAELGALGRRRALEPTELAALFERAVGLLDRLLLHLVTTYVDAIQIDTETSR